MCLAVPGKIVEIDNSSNIKMCKVDFGGVIRQVCIETLPEAKVGDYTIVHAGFALSLLSEEEALDTLAMLNEMEAAADAEENDNDVKEYSSSQKDNS
jgi:hydrogenase expression/formation protein HypC